MTFRDVLFASTEYRNRTNRQRNRRPAPPRDNAGTIQRTWKKPSLSKRPYATSLVNESLVHGRAPQPPPQPPQNRPSQKSPPQKPNITPNQVSQATQIVNGNFRNQNTPTPTPTSKQNEAPQNTGLLNQLFTKWIRGVKPTPAMPLEKIK